MGFIDIRYAQYIYEGLMDSFLYRADGSFKPNVKSFAKLSIEHLVKTVKNSFDAGAHRSIIGLIGTLDEDVAFRSSPLTQPEHVGFSSLAKPYGRVSDRIMSEYLLNVKSSIREKNILALEIYNNGYRPHPVINIDVLVPFFYADHSAAAIVKELKGGSKVCYNVLYGERYDRLMHFSNTRLNDIGQQEIYNLKEMLGALRPMIQSNVFASAGGASSSDSDRSANR